MVIVDTRGGSAGEAGARKRLSALHNLGVEADLGFLEFGDYAIAGNGPNDTTVMVGAELKTTKDLINSLRSGRLIGHQTPGMVQMYEGRAWLLTEGIWREGRNGDFEVYQGSWQTYSAGNRPIQMRDLEAWILSTVIGGGYSYWHCPLQHDTARFVAGLNHFWCDKKYEEHRTHNVIYRKPPDRVMFTEPSDFVQMVSVPEKIGWQKAMEIERYFDGDFDRLHDASVDELCEIQGIGKTLAKTLYKSLHPKRSAA